VRRVRRVPALLAQRVSGWAAVNAAAGRWWGRHGGGAGVAVRRVGSVAAMLAAAGCRCGKWALPPQRWRRRVPGVAAVVEAAGQRCGGSAVRRVGGAAGRRCGGSAVRRVGSAAAALAAAGCRRGKWALPPPWWQRRATLRDKNLDVEVFAGPGMASSGRPETST